MLRQTTAQTRALVIISTIVVVVALLLLATGEANGAEPVVPYTVEAGDTLWDIAAQRTQPGADVRATVLEISQLNDLHSSLIVPGQVLVVPLAG
jgi:LysM repeat protein